MGKSYHVSIRSEAGRSHASVLHDTAESAVAMAREVTGQSDAKGAEKLTVGAQGVVYRGNGRVAIVTPIEVPTGSERPEIPLPAAPATTRRPRKARRRS